MTGTKLIDVTDVSRTEVLCDGQEPRRFTVRFYYPGAEEPGRQPTSLLTEKKRASYGKKADFTLYDKRVKVYDGLKVREGRFPLILFSHSYGGDAEQNSDLCAFLAERGYIVASISHTYEAGETVFEDGTVIPVNKAVTKKGSEPLLPTLRLALRKLTPEKALEQFDIYQKKYSGFGVERLQEWVKDDRCAIRRIKELNRTETSFLYQKIDLAHGIGATGHSLGGAAAYAHCLMDDEITCGVNMDGGLFGNFGETVNHKPFMQIVGKLNRNFVTRCLLYSDAPVHYLLFKQMMHMGFTDLKLIVRIPLAVGRADPILALDTLNEAHGAFFDRYLKGADTQDGRPLPVTADALEEYKVL